MSVSLQERKERAESRIEALLLGLDNTVREVYNSLLESGADYDELTEEKKVARLEGFHDYIITREETGVDHPSLAEYIVAKKKYGNEMLSFGTGSHRNPIEGEEFIDEEIENSPLAAEVDEVPEFVVTGHPGGGLSSLLEEDEVYANGEDTVIVEDSEEYVAPVTPEAEAVEEDVTSEAEEATDEDSVAEESADEASEEVEYSDESEVNDEDAANDEVTNDVINDEVSESQSFFDDDDEVVIQSYPTPLKEEEKVLPASEAAGRINSKTILHKELSTKIGGYNMDEVDETLDKLAEFFKEPHTSDDYLAKAKSVEGSSFSKKTFKKGFAQDEVDGFLKVIALELRNLAEEAK